MELPHKCACMYHGGLHWKSVSSRLCHLPAFVSLTYLIMSQKALLILLQFYWCYFRRHFYYLHFIAEGVFRNPLVVVHLQTKAPELTQDRGTGASGVEGPWPNIFVHVYHVPNRSINPATGSIIQPGWVQGLYILSHPVCLQCTATKWSKRRKRRLKED